LDQRLSTVPQHNWVSKLLGYDFEVEFCPGRLNVVADALSRRHEDQGTLMAISAPRFDIFDDLRREQSIDPALVALREQQTGNQLGDHWSITNGLLTFEGVPATFFIIPADNP
jgi:hypothetical protein